MSWSGGMKSITATSAEEIGMETNVHNTKKFGVNVFFCFGP